MIETTLVRLKSLINLVWIAVRARDNSHIRCKGFTLIPAIQEH